MKKTLFLFMCLFLVSCKPFDVNEVIDEAGNPFKEYTVIEKDVVETLEKGILEVEIDNNGLVPEKSSAHVISLKKVGTYASGEVKILGNLTPEKQKELNKKSDIVSYSCLFEYSYKTGQYIWRSNYVE